MRQKVYVAEFCNIKITKVDTWSDFFIQDKVRQTNKHIHKLLIYFLFVKMLKLKEFFFCADNTAANISQENDKSNIADILLWAIFANRKELAEICWLRGRNHLCKYF